MPDHHPHAATQLDPPHLDRRRLLALAGLGTAAVIATPELRAAAEDGATANVLDFGADPTSTEHSGEAFQAAIDSLPESGGTVIVPPGTYLLARDKVVQLRSHITIEGRDATIVRKARVGSYTVFAGLAGGGTGRNSGPTDVTMRGLKFMGDYSELTVICAMALNHCSDFLIENCEFVECQGTAGHTFDLCGCENITFRDCVWRGGRVNTTTPPTLEAIQLDVSLEATVSYPDDPASYDALATRNVTIERCRFLPWTTAEGEFCPAPNPIGAHFEQEAEPYKGIVLRDVEIVDPATDPRPPNNVDNVRPPRGIIHIPQAQDVLIENLTVRSTTGGITNRLFMFTSNSWGRRTEGGRDYYREAVLCKNIEIRNLLVEGFRSDPDEDPTMNPIIWINGVDDGHAENINIQGTIRNGGAAAVMINKAKNVNLALDVEDYRIGADLTRCTLVNITDSTFTGVDTPIQLEDVQRFGISGVSGTHSTTQPAAVVLDSASDFGTVAGTHWTGYEAVLSGGGSNVVLQGNTTTP